MSNSSIRQHHISDTEIVSASQSAVRTASPLSKDQKYYEQPHEAFHPGDSTSVRFAEAEEEDEDDEEEGEAFKWDFILQSPLLTPRSNPVAAEYMGLESGRQALSSVPAFSPGKGKEIAFPLKEPVASASMSTNPVGANELITDNPINREFEVYVDEMPTLSRHDSVGPSARTPEKSSPLQSQYSRPNSALGFHGENEYPESSFSSSSEDDSPIRVTGNGGAQDEQENLLPPPTPALQYSTPEFQSALNSAFTLSGLGNPNPLSGASPLPVLRSTVAESSVINDRDKALAHYRGLNLQFARSNAALRIRVDNQESAYQALSKQFNELEQITTAARAEADRATTETGDLYAELDWLMAKVRAYESAKEMEFATVTEGGRSKRLSQYLVERGVELKGLTETEVSLVDRWQAKVKRVESENRALRDRITLLEQRIRDMESEAECAVIDSPVGGGDGVNDSECF